MILETMRDLNKQSSLSYKTGLWIHMLCSIFLTFSIYSRYDIKMKWDIKSKIYTPYDNLINTGVWRPLLFEMVITEMIKFNFLKIWINHKSHQLSYKFVNLSKTQRSKIFIEWIVHELVITSEKESFTR